MWVRCCAYLPGILLAFGGMESLGAALSWDGGGDGQSWDDPMNWQGDRVPGPEDDVVIENPDPSLQVYWTSETTAINSLVVANDLILAGGFFAVTGALNIRGGKAVVTATEVVFDSFLAENATLVVGPSRFSGPVVVDGGNLELLPEFQSQATIIMRGDTRFTGAVKTDQTLWIQGSRAGGHARMVAEAALRNAGEIVLESIETSLYRSELEVPALEILAGGVVAVNRGGGGTRRIFGPILNDGQIRLGADQALEMEGSLVQHGDLEVGARAGLTVRGSLQNEGNFILNEAAWMDVDLEGDGLFSQSGSGTTTAATDGGFSLIDGTARWEGGALPVGTVFHDMAVTRGAAADSATLIIARGEVEWQGDLGPDQEIWVQGGGGNLRRDHARLILPGGMQNAGHIRLESVSGSVYRSELVVSSGTLTNVATLEFRSGTGGGRLSQGTLLNRGLITVGAGVVLNHAGDIQNEASGEILLEGQAEATVNGEVLQEGRLQVDSGGFLHCRLSGTGEFRQTQGTTAIADSGRLLVEDGTLFLKGGAVGNQVECVDSRFVLDPAVTGNTAFVLQGECEFQGILPPPQTLQILGQSATGNALVRWTGGLRNAGRIALITQDGDIWSASLEVPDGTCINETTGLIQMPASSGGRRFFIGNVDNYGSFEIAPETEFAIAGNFKNFGSLDIQNGAGGGITGGSVENHGNMTLDADVHLLIHPGVGKHFLQTGMAATAVDSTASLDIRECQVDLAGGTFGPAARLEDVELRVDPLVTEALDLVLEGECTWDGDLRPGQSLWIRGGRDGGNAVVTAVRSFSNAGLIRLESIDGDLWHANLSLAGWVLTNLAEGRIELNQGAGGMRRIEGFVVNRGTVTSHTVATLLQVEGIRPFNASSAPLLQVALDGTLQNFGSLELNTLVSLTINGSFENDGVVSMARDAQLRLELAGSGSWIQRGGFISTPPTSRLLAHRGRVELAGGRLDGTAEFSHVALSIQPEIEGPDTLRFTGPNEIAGPIVPGQTVILLGGGNNDGHAVLRARNGLTNAGTLILDSTNGSLWRASLEVTGGPLENRGRIEVLPGTGGGRSLVGAMQNMGEFLVAQETTLGSANAAHQNQGSLQLQNSRLNLVGKDFRNLAGGIVRGSGVIDARSVALQNLGLMQPGIDSTGKLTILGTLLLAPESRLEFILAAPNPVLENAPLRVVGPAQLDGVLAVDTAGNFVPALGARFVMLAYENHRGEFESMEAPDPAPGIFFDSFYHPHNLTLYAVDKPLSPPVILTSPIDQLRQVDESLEFLAEVNGTGPLFYQWRHNGVNLEGANQPIFTRDAVQPSDAGNYRLIAMNEFGFAASDFARLDVQLQGLNFNALADQWGESLVVRTANGFASADNQDAGREPGEPDHLGRSGGKSMWLTWIPPADGIATISTAGSDFDTLVAVYTGDSLSNLAFVTGNDDAGPGLAGETEFNATAGVPYHIVVDGFDRAVGQILLSWNLVAEGVTAPVIRQHPKNVVTTLGNPARFEVVAEGTGPLEYQWFHNDQAVNQATDPTFQVNSVTPSDLGNYRVRVRNPAGISIRSDPAQLEIGADPRIESSFKLRDVFALNEGSAGVAAAGTFPHAFTSVAAGSIGSQLYDNFGATTEPGEPDHGGVIGGASTWFGIIPQTDGLLRIHTQGSAIDTVLAVYSGTSLRDLSLIISDDNGGADGVTSLVELPATGGDNYLVAVDGVNGAVGTIQLQWQLGIPPTILNQPISQAVPEGQPVEFSVLAEAAPSPSYQWRWNGIDLPGESQPSLTLSAVAAELLGQYSVKIENEFGLAVSDPAFLAYPGELPVEIRFQKVSHDGVFQAEILAPGVSRLKIESSEDLILWEPIGELDLEDGVGALEDVDGASDRKRFYRATDTDQNR